MNYIYLGQYQEDTKLKAYNNVYSLNPQML